MEKSSKCSKLLPYHIIAAAASGDVEAINEVLKHYEGYIAALSTRKLYDECVGHTLLGFETERLGYNKRNRIYIWRRQ